MSSILDAIGNTPLVRLQRCVPENGAELWLKLEYLNPTGSMKDRMALAYTGGSTGPALTLVCNAKSYRPLIVMADCYSEERFQMLRALGADIDVVASVEGRPRVTAQDIANMVARAEELAQRPHHYATDQFSNPYVTAAHRDGLGRELWEQSDGRITAFVQGVGTASSLNGVSDALRRHGVHIQALEPAASPAIAGGPKGAFAMQGWAGSVVAQWDPDRVDGLDAIGNDEAIAMTARLARDEGILAGVSTGANVVGALRLAERLGPDAVIATLAVDSGFKYLSISPYADL